MLFENENTESRPAWRRQRQSKLNELHNNRRQPSSYRPSHDGDVKMPRPVHKPHRAGLQASGVDGGECGPSNGGNQTADGQAECIILPSTPPRSLGYRTKPHRFLSHFDLDRRFHSQKGSSEGSRRSDSLRFGAGRSMVFPSSCDCVLCRTVLWQISSLETCSSPGGEPHKAGIPSFHSAAQAAVLPDLC
jgi:hypothetical protein